MALHQRPRIAGIGLEMQDPRRVGVQHRIRLTCSKAGMRITLRSRRALGTCRANLHHPAPAQPALRVRPARRVPAA